MSRAAVGVLVSGRGSNMAALIAAAAAPDYPAQITLVVSDKAEAGALARAREAGIEADLVERARFADRAAFEEALDARLRAAGVEVVALAGFMRILSPRFVAAWAGRMINIHPSLLPAFPGLDTHARALQAGAKLHGCTVHIVTEGVDEGPILGQAAVPVRPGDDAAALAARVLAAEHVLYPACLAGFVGGASPPPPAQPPILYAW